MKETQKKARKKPDWLKVKVPAGKSYLNVKEIVNKHKLHTICTSGLCPNICDCWERGTATLMILGDICTRSCNFCAVKTGKPLAVDNNEPKMVARSVKLLNLNHVVLTSVDRDDLPDGGAAIWAATIKAIKKEMPQTSIETLIPDFGGNKESLDMVIEAAPDVVSHNLETVRRLTPQIRSVAEYDRSLDVIAYVSRAGVTTKSGIMAGLGETEDEVLETMDDLIQNGCDVFTIGQYLQPTMQHLPVTEYVTPKQFKKYEQIGREKGFKYVESDPLVRSSYHAERHVIKT